MSWATTALLSAGFIALVNILDSHLISKRMPGLRVYLICASVVILGYGLIVLLLNPFPEAIEVFPLFIAVLSGIIRALALIIFLYTLKTEEVSKAVPIVYTFPVFVAIFALFTLGESLNLLQWAAVVMVVIGAFIVSQKDGIKGLRLQVNKVFLILLGSSILMAIGEVGTKYALDYFSFWNMYVITMFCVVGGFLVLSLRSNVVKQLREIKWSFGIVFLMLLTETMAFFGMVNLLSAVEEGPVSLVSAISGSRPIFVLAFAFILSSFWRDSLYEGETLKGVLPRRLAATMLVVLGVVIIYIS